MAGTALGAVQMQESRQKKSYAGYKLIRTEPLNNMEAVETLMTLDGHNGVHFWTFPKQNLTTDILTSPGTEMHVRDLLNNLGLSHNVVIEDVDELLKTENPDLPEGSLDPKQGAGHRMTWQKYHRYADIVNWATFLRDRDPMVKVESIGKTHEKRDIIMLKISKSGGGSKPAIWIDGGMHAREWISPATVTYIANKLVTNNKRQYDDLLEMFDWYIVPVVNADGYEFTHTGDRFWRKTRSGTGNIYCKKGVDPNRNWDFKWGSSGSSKDPCSDIYAGPRAFSESETQSMSQKILQLRSQLKMYLTFHSYSQLWLIPYGYSKYEKPADYNELVRLASQGKAALERTYGTRYQMGTAPDLLYEAAGGSDDWAKGVAGIKYSYCLELRDTGRYGFALPASQIVPTGEETMNGVAALARSLATKLGLKAAPKTDLLEEY
ncbi:unnamed protein product [Allacma fusca]|uniref:Peptidase M14 domain-containing protein n=1 Tax=Allacma fusca TaxID=39272 RepID=A0A8J2PUE7_9HEXA|nr:unnamed protein product [Allacma fusca]